MLDKKRYAIQAFYEGKNCAQSVIIAYANEFNMDTQQALNLALGFGGGMGKMQKTCGAASGAYMLIGMRNSAVITDELKLKNTTPVMIQEFNKRFIRANGSDQCNKLLNIDLLTDEGRNAFKADDMKKEICSKCVTSAIDILDDLFASNNN